MRKSLRNVRFATLVLLLLQTVGNSSADTCNKYHKRAPVKSVCGHVSNPLGELPAGAELTLLTPTGSEEFTAKADSKGAFDFGQVPKGDYTLRAVAPGYTTEERQIRVTSKDRNSCKQPKIEVRLGLRSCDGGVYIKGVDKKSDLFSKKGSSLN